MDIFAAVSVFGCIKGGQEDRFEEWTEYNYLLLNIKKA